MSLNINFQGDVVDENGNIIECSYQAFSTNIQKWSDIRQTDQGQYNVNFGDGDLNTQSGTVSTGDALMIVFWTGGDDRNSEHEYFSAVVFVYDGNDNVIQNVQILTPHNPDCSFSVQQDVNIGDIVVAESHASTIYQWAFDEKIHYQRKEWYGQAIFGFLDIYSDEFNFGNGYSDENTYIYDDFGTYDVGHLVKSTYSGFESECTQQVMVHLREPITSISIDNESPIVGDIVNISFSTSDVDNTIENIIYYIGDKKIGEGSDLNFEYQYTVESLAKYPIVATVYWNDGFDDIVTEYEIELAVKNQPPEVAISYINDDETYIFTVNANDPDGTVESICWQIFYSKSITGMPDPFFKCEETVGSIYEEIYNECNIGDTLKLAFAIPGKYKIVATATDNYGESSYDYSEINVTSVCGVSQEQGSDDDCDCYDEIRLAIEECISKYNTGDIDVGERVILVNDSRASNIVSGSTAGKIGASITSEDLIASISKSIKGVVPSGSTSGSIGGKISGTIKK